MAIMDKMTAAPITDVLDGMEAVDSYGVEHILYLNSDNILQEGEQLDIFNSSSVLHFFEDAELTYFHSDNRPLEEVEPGKVYISGKKVWNAVAIGDMLEIRLGDSGMLKMTYVMDMIIAGTLLAVSVCLILIAFVVLRFTISFVLTEEYREIGVMKAIGIGSAKIRSLYMVKYFALALAGAANGFERRVSCGSTEAM